MTRNENHNDPRSQVELRASFIELTHDIEVVEHIGRHNRLFGRRRKIAEQLIAAGGNSERELLPLLEDSSPAVSRNGRDSSSGTSANGRDAQEGPTALMDGPAGSELGSE